MTSRQISGGLQIGQGKVTEIFHVCCDRSVGTGNNIDILVSSDGRGVWIILDKASARMVAEAILEELNKENE